MLIISRPDVIDKIVFADLEDGAVFQREGSRKLYLKSSHSSKVGGNCTRLSNGLRSTVKEDEIVIIRDDACVRFDRAEG